MIMASTSAKSKQGHTQWPSEDLPVQLSGTHVIFFFLTPKSHIAVLDQLGVSNATPFPVKLLKVSVKVISPSFPTPCFQCRSTNMEQGLLL